MSSFRILVSNAAMPLYSFFNCTAKLFDDSSVLGLAALLALELSVVFDDNVKLEDAMEGAYDDVDDAETYPTDDLGVGIGREDGRASTENRTGSSFRWSNSCR